MIPTRPKNKLEISRLEQLPIVLLDLIQNHLVLTLQLRLIQSSKYFYNHLCIKQITNTNINKINKTKWNNIFQSFLNKKLCENLTELSTQKWCSEKGLKLSLKHLTKLQHYEGY